MNLRRLNEEIKQFLLESNGNYTVRAIVGRDRDEEGTASEDTFSAEDDFKAFIHVIEDFDTFITSEYEVYKNGEENEFTEAFAEYNKGNMEKAIKILTDLYFRYADYSDYYNNIVDITGPNGIVFEDGTVEDAYDEFKEMDDEYYGDEAEDESEDEEPQSNNKPKTFAEWFGKDLTGQVYEGDIDCSHVNLISLKGAPKEITGNFYCGRNHLTSLEGAPEKVGGNFYCPNNNLTSLQGAPKEVGGNFGCGCNNLTSLKGSPKYVGGNFACYENNLTSLEGCPKRVDGEFDCTRNKLISLEYGPKEVTGDFSCAYNKLSSLQGAPEKVNGYFICNSNLETEAKKLGYKVGHRIWM